MKHLHLLVYYMIKDVIKDRDDQLDDEIHRARPRRVLHLAASAPMKTDCATLLAHECVHKSSLNTGIWEMFMEASSYKYDLLFTQFPVLLSSLENEGWG